MADLVVTRAGVVDVSMLVACTVSCELGFTGVLVSVLASSKSCLFDITLDLETAMPQFVRGDFTLRYGQNMVLSSQQQLVYVLDSMCPVSATAHHNRP